MADLTPFEYDSQLVVDSRLIAEELGIAHDNFIQTITSYQTLIEKDFGIVLFETEKINRPGRPERFALLTEDQATFLMTLSRNTPQVVQCKVKLVKGFSEAKSLLKKKQITFNDYTLGRISIHHSINQSPLPDGYFACFDKMIEILQKLDIRLGYQLGERWYDIKNGVERYLEPDISIGRHFSSFFTSNYVEDSSKYQEMHESRRNNPKIRKLWSEELIKLKWKSDRAFAEQNLRQQHFGSVNPIHESEIDRLRYNFKPLPDSGRPEVLDAYCYSNKYTALFYDWLREIFFKFCWRDYILERDKVGWMKRYSTFQSLPERERTAILTTSEGGLISGFEFQEIWSRQLPSS